VTQRHTHTLVRGVLVWHAVMAPEVVHHEAGIWACGGGGHEPILTALTPAVRVQLQMQLGQLGRVVLPCWQSQQHCAMCTHPCPHLGLGAVVGYAALCI
jgi:hypothetical protein